MRLIQKYLTAALMTVCLSGVSAQAALPVQEVKVARPVGMVVSDDSFRF